ncbi:transposase [Citricoccus sp. NPDC079358]|uniref:transposase n=1 Tax=Citricoccus sp. NPDC079358 TaxID=3154653 RepID=UPI001EE22AD9|nr:MULTISPECIES: transposase [Micrococcaceae]
MPATPACPSPAPTPPTPASARTPDGLKGLPEAITTTWERTVVQQCIVHLIRNSFRYAGRQHRDGIVKALKPVYTAPSEQAAKDRFAEFTAEWGQRYPAIVRLWESSWAEFVPFLEYDVEIRRVICTTNAIVISSPPYHVLDVGQGRSGCFGRRGGRAYLQCVHHGRGWRADVGAEGDHPGCGGRVVDGARRR